MINSQSTMITEWDLVCEDKWLKTFAKLLLFSGKHFIFLSLDCSHMIHPDVLGRQYLTSVHFSPRGQASTHGAMLHNFWKDANSATYIIDRRNFHALVFTEQCVIHYKALITVDTGQTC